MGQPKKTIMQNQQKIQFKNSTDAIYVRAFIPDNPKVVLQIIPGVSDYIDRYMHLADFLNQDDILVIGHDHIGQGKSISSTHQLGNFGENGLEQLILNTKNVSLLVKKYYPDIPLFILGHSMGSMTLTQLLKETPTTYAGAILTSPIKAPEFSNLLLSFLKPLTHINSSSIVKEINNLVYEYFNRDFELKSRLSWIVNNQQELDELQRDPLVGYDYTVSSLIAILKLAIISDQSDWIQKLEKSLPILIMSGTLDPAGAYGLKLMQLANEFEKAKLNNIETKLCFEMQHELLNAHNASETFPIIRKFIQINSKDR